jgi:hypothetical protein
MPLAASPARPWVRGRLKCQVSRPVRASSAIASFTDVTYITPSTTTGVPSSARGASCTVNIHFGASFWTLPVLI